MKRAFAASSLVLAFLLFIAAGCRSGGGDLSKASSQRAFGVRMAKMNLWREAMFRFQRAIEIEPQNAMAHNNLAVAYEANGDFDNAAKEYREALRLDRSNQYIQKNYSRFVEFTQRSRKRETKPATVTAAPPTTAPGTTAPAAATSAPAVPPAAPAPAPTAAQPAVTPPAPPATDTTATTTTNPPEEGVR